MILFPTDCNILDFQFLHPDMIFFSPLFPRILRARQTKQHNAQWAQTVFEQAFYMILGTKSMGSHQNLREIVILER